MRAGDELLSIDGRDARGLDVDEAVRRMRGAPGSHVRVTFQRRGQSEPLRLDLVREVVHVSSVESRMMDNGVGYLALKSFQERSSDEVTRGLDELTRSSGGRLQGLVLDLRNDPGGLLDEAIFIADEFLADGVIVSTRGRDGAAQDEARAHAAGTRPDFPVVVLVNEYTASAAEILAGALQTTTGRSSWASAPSARGASRPSSTCPTAAPSSSPSRAISPPRAAASRPRGSPRTSRWSR